MRESKIKFIWDSTVSKIEGNEMVRQIRLKNTKDATISSLPAGGIFIDVGLEPNTSYLRDIVPLDEQGYIITNELMETKLPGIFAAGDVCHNSIRQATAAAGDGAIAAIAAGRFLSLP